MPLCEEGRFVRTAPPKEEGKICRKWEMGGISGANDSKKMLVSFKNGGVIYLQLNPCMLKKVLILNIFKKYVEKS